MEEDHSLQLILLVVGGNCVTLHNVYYKYLRNIKRYCNRKMQCMAMSGGYEKLEVEGA